MSKPYVYWLRNKIDGTKYVGVRFAKNCSPDDLWKSYFSSSKLIHQLIKRYGVDSFDYRIIKTFDNSEDAILYEAALLKKIVLRKDYANIACSMAFAGKLTTEVCAKAGRIGGMVQVSKKLGIHKQTKEERERILMDARKKQIEMKANKFIFVDREVQSERGKKGGPKNKGFVWLSNGNRCIKYTKKMQEEKPVEEFLRENPDFFRGRSHKHSKKRKSSRNENQVNHEKNA